jgi:hypothetical protein
MKVSSPIGELPFEPTRIRYRNRTVELDGLMGAWPARVVIEPGDLPGLIRVLARPLLAGPLLAGSLLAGAAAGAAAGVAVGMIRRRRRRSS